MCGVNIQRLSQQHMTLRRSGWGGLYLWPLENFSVVYCRWRSPHDKHIPSPDLTCVCSVNFASRLVSHRRGRSSLQACRCLVLFLRLTFRSDSRGGGGGGGGGGAAPARQTCKRHRLHIETVPHSLTFLAPCATPARASCKPQPF